MIYTEREFIEARFGPTQEARDTAGAQVEKGIQQDLDLLMEAMEVISASGCQFWPDPCPRQKCGACSMLEDLKERLAP